MVQNEKICLLCLIWYKPFIIWSSVMAHRCKMIISLGTYFQFFKILIFQVVRGAKGQKMVQNNKKVSLSHFISLELYIIWLSFMLHMCKMIISSCGFFFFLNFNFWGCVRGVKGQKAVQNDKKFCLLHSISQETYIIWLSFMVHICKMIICSGVFFVFSKFWFSRSIGT